ncbi:MAG: MtrB/PioB family outer membrane beta-barrel protein [Betaproteobacteria bacterium]
MRTRFIGMAAALLLVSAGAGAQEAPTAQQDVPKTPAPSIQEFGFVNEIDFGGRATSFDTGSDKARFQRYQDLRDGATLDKFRFSRSTDSWLFNAQADHVGYRDQRFSGAFNDYGKVKASFQWNQTPLFYSETTRTLYTQSSPGVLTLPSGIQSGIANKSLTLATAMAGASAFDLQTRRDVADFNLTYSATRQLDLNVRVKNTSRNGSQPMTAGFGFSMATDELAAPIDTRTTEFGTSLEWGNNRGFAKLAYDGSFFRNNIQSLTWANPMRAVDASGSPTQGRLALWPDTNQNTVSASGGVNLPGRSHANAYLSVGNLTNNSQLIPFTINTALASPTLSRSTADLTARVTAMNFTFTSRPVTMLWLSARYRQYQFDNRSNPFVVTQGVGYDSSLTTLNAESELFGYTRHTFDADASFSPIRYVGIRGGYTREQVDRTFRWIEATTEDVARTSIDLTGISWVTVRGVYEHSKRTGANSITAEELIAESQQPGQGMYDISNRNRDRFSAIVTVTPVSMFSITGSAAAGKDDYPAPAGITAVNQFGLLNNDNRIYSIGFDLVPVEDKVILGATYGYEKYTALQQSRLAGHVTSGLPPTFFNPLYDWSDSSADKVHTANASVEITKVIPKADVKFGYDYSKADSTYVYAIPAGSPMAAPRQLPPVTNKIQRGTADVLYHVTPHVGAGFTYWYDAYSVSDFALGPQPSLALGAVSNPTIMMLGYNWIPYTAHTFMARLTYLW